MTAVMNTTAADRRRLRQKTISTLIHDSGDMNRWQCLDPDNWSESDVLDFIYSLDDVSPETLYGERFRGLRGFELCRLSLQEFRVRDQQHGQLIYERLHSLLRQRHYGTISMAEQLQTFPCMSNTGVQQQTLQLPEPVCNLVEDEFSNGGWSVDSGQWSPSSRYIGHGGTVSSSRLSPTSQLTGLLFSEHPASSNQRVLTDMLDITDVAEDDVSVCHFQPLQLYDDSQSEERQPVVSSTTDSSRQHRNRGQSQRARKRDTKASEIRDSVKPKRMQNRTGGHLWEFIRRLLSLSDAESERIIQWENKSEGVFRFLNPDAVAERWGKQKSNRRTAMDYPKLSRALRWCQSEGYLAKVPKDAGYPRKLCFQFGPKAVNWEDELR